MKKFSLLFIIGAFAFSFWSCSEDEDNPDYIGDWISIYTEDGVENKELLSLAASTFENVVSQKETGEWVESFGLKGNMTVSGKEISMIITAVGGRNYDPQTLEVLDFEWFDDGTTNFTLALQFFGGNKTPNGEYEVNGETLTLKIDYDDDGSYSADEILEYTKL